MVIDGAISTGGIIILLAFSGAATILFSGIIFCCCRERKSQKAVSDRIEAAKFASTAAAKRPVVQERNVSDSRPLMGSDSYGAPPQQEYYQPEQHEEGAQQTGPFTDSHGH